MTRCAKCWDDGTLWERQGGRSVEVPCAFCQNNTPVSAPCVEQPAPRIVQKLKPVDELQAGDRFWQVYEVVNTDDSALIICRIPGRDTPIGFSKTYYNQFAKAEPEAPKPTIYKTQEHPPTAKDTCIVGEVLVWVSIKKQWCTIGYRRVSESPSLYPYWRPLSSLEPPMDEQ